MLEIIDSQFLEIENISSEPEKSVLVIIVGDDIRNAVESLKKQVYSNREVVCIQPRTEYRGISGKVDLNSIGKKKLSEKIFEVTARSDADYVYILDGADTLLPNGLMEFSEALSKKEYDALYADECKGCCEDRSVFSYQLKPEFEPIAAFQALYTGKAVIWKREMLLKVLPEVKHEQLDIMLMELFQLVLLHDGIVSGISSVLLLKETPKGMSEEEIKIKKKFSEYPEELVEGVPMSYYLKRVSRRADNVEKELLLLLQRNVAKHTNWEGVMNQSEMVNPYTYELISAAPDLSFEFVMIEEDYERLSALAEQFANTFSQHHLIVAVTRENRNDMEYISLANRFKDVDIIEREDTYTKTLEKMTGYFKKDLQILLSDRIHLLYHIEITRLLGIFHKPEVSAACPQIVTNARPSKIVYAGGGLDSFSMMSTSFKYRERYINKDYDLAQVNHRVKLLSKYCMVLRKEVWKEIFPIHSSIRDAQQFATEVSFMFEKKGLIAEYAAQSLMYVDKGYEDLYCNTDAGVKIEPGLEVLRRSGSYIHWMNAYGSQIAAESKKNQYRKREYSRRLKEGFQMYGNEYITEKQKNVLVVTHELSLTGAPLVLVEGVKSLRNMGYQVFVLSPEDGPLRKVYQELQVPVFVEPELLTQFESIRCMYDFDFVVLNTIVLHPLSNVLGKTSIPVLWWIHDAKLGYVNWLRSILPKTLGNNIHVYSVGEYAKAVIQEFIPSCNSKILLYGLEDFADQMGQSRGRVHWELPEDKVIFANMGQFVSRKGQDILARAIEKLPADVMEKAYFLFVGKVIEQEIYEPVRKLSERYPGHIRYIKQMPHDDLMEMVAEADCIVCPSTDDPMPTFVTEGFILSKPCICSTNTAFRGLIDHGKNSMLFTSGDEDELAECITRMVRDDKARMQMGQAGRELYEKNFRKEVFDQALRKIVADDLQ